ncbi:hypothetical protein B0J14DRAFT_600001 [Halenospora varia]|nr:hypothetical protein B0J14DRAFT_600001 [Halenospora varia]
MVSASRKTTILAISFLIATVILLFCFQIVSSTDSWILGQIPPVRSSSKDDTKNFIPPPSVRKAAAIIENRPLDSLIPVILHFAAVLGPEWPIHIFSSEGNMGIFTTSAPIQREVNNGRFHLRTLPAEFALNTHASVSSFFTKPWFWEAMDPVEHVLLFQADSIICIKSPQRVDDFLQYDFVGAPVDEGRGLGMGWNGGLSIRNRSMCLDIVRTHNWEEERHGDHSQGNVDYEDQWFSKRMREMPLKADGAPGANLPPLEVAQMFSVETMWHDRPLGYHQATVWQPGRMEEILAWCPEYKMSMIETFTDHNPDA